MKKILLLGCGLALVAGSASAQGARMQAAQRYADRRGQVARLPVHSDR